MRFGVCAPLEKIDKLAAVGYDYIELGVRNALIPEASDAEFQEIQERVAQATLKPEAYSGFLPGNLRVVGDAVDFSRLSRYVETACRRAKGIGGEIIVYGSSGSRNLEEGYSEERALDQIAEFLDMAADHAEANDIIPILTDYIALAVLSKYGNEVIFAIAAFGYFPRIWLNCCCICSNV